MVKYENTLQLLNYKNLASETQYFEKVPQIAWEFYIGGHQPAQKCLKVQKLEFEDIFIIRKSS